MIHQHGTRLSSLEFQRLVASDLSQREKVVQFLTLSGQWHTAEEVYEAVKTERTPLTSIRRTLSDLTNEGHTEKDEENKKAGSFGVRLCTYRIKRQLKMF